MTTLADIALTVATQLGRVNETATAISDLENEIKTEIKNTVKFYNRKPLHLLEMRGGTLTTEIGVTWYDSVQTGTGARSVAGLVGATDGEGVVIDVDGDTQDIFIDQILDIHYMRENPGASGLNEPLSEVPYMHFERMFEGSTPQGQPEFFTRYGRQIGIWPTPAAEHVIYWSGVVKPIVPESDDDVSVWFLEANELIEAGAARRVCVKYLRDNERAGIFAAEEAAAYNQLQHEYVSKASTGRLRSHD